MYLPFRCVGKVTHGEAFVFRMGKEGYVATCVGKSFNIFDTRKLRLKVSSASCKRKINAICCLGETTFTANGTRILVWVRGKLLKELEGHSKPVHLLYLLGSFLLSVDKENVVHLWDAVNFENCKDGVCMDLKSLGSPISCVLHPSTYLNKIVFGTESGRYHLWNIKTGKLIYSFSGWNSPVLCMQQSPALDVVGIGLGDGRVVLHNLKLDKEVAILRHSSGSPVTAISFRSDVGAVIPTMVSADSSGMIVVWDLEKKKMLSLVKSAHRVGGVASLAFLPGEPVMVSSGGADNSLKMWILDSDDGSARLLRERSGHSAPARVLQFATDTELLSGGGDGCVRRISIIQDHRSVELSQKPLKKAMGGKMKHFPPVAALSYCDSRKKEWNSLVSVHAGMNSLWPWKGDKLGNEGWSPPNDSSSIRCCIVTRCGNFAMVGTAAGGLYKVNVQSGIWRGENAKAHVGSVEGVVTDILETVAISCGLDGFIRVWDLKDLTLIEEIDVGSPLGNLVIHREGGLFAVSADDWCVRVYDLESRSLAREFRGHKNQISALAFSGDCKWIVSASSDSTIRTWDIVSAHCIDGFRCPNPAIALAFSPKNDLLATAHLDDVGVFLWSNRAYFSHVYLKPFSAESLDKRTSYPSEYEEEEFFVTQDVASGSGELSGEDKEAEGSAAWDFLNKEAPEDKELITFSGEPETKFLSIIHVEDVKERNKPVMPATQPARAPFALPTIAGVSLQFQVPEKKDENSSHILDKRELSTAKGPLSDLLEQCHQSMDWTLLAQKLRNSSASAVDANIRLLSLENDFNELVLFMDYLTWHLEARQDFDLVQGYIHCFLNAHGDMLIAQPKLKECLKRLHLLLQAIWKEVEQVMQKSLCICSLLTKIEGL